MIVRRHVEREPRHLPVALALVLGVLVALVVPALASAADFEVNGTGDGTTTTACETGMGECTLRGAVAAADVEANLDEITFAPTFDGGSGSTIALGSTLYVTKPVKILDTVSGGVPDATVQVSGSAISISNSATATVVEGLGIEATGIGIQVSGDIGAKVIDNFVSGAQAAIEVNPGGTNTGANLIEGNVIHVPYEYKFGIVVQAGENHIFGNQIEGSGCCYTGIWTEGSSSGNQIGGDTAASENVITGFSNGSINIQASGNEVGRNRGDGGYLFLHTAAATPAPTITSAQQPKVAGTGESGAIVRVFATQSEGLNEIEGFVGQATVNGSDDWEVSLAGVPVGQLITATQTLAGETSGLSATTAVTAEPAPPSGGGGGTTTPVTTPPTTTVPITAPAPPKPTVKITSGPKKSSTATTAKFKFKATNVSGAKFECRLDNAKWASCKSPKTYKKLKPKKHTFQVRAKADGLISSVAKFSFTVKR